MKKIADMTLTELREYAQKLEEENAQIPQLRKSCESSFEKVRLLTQELDATRTEANTKLSFVQQAIGTCYSSIIFATKS